MRTYRTLMAFQNLYLQIDFSVLCAKKRKKQKHTNKKPIVNAMIVRQRNRSFDFDITQSEMCMAPFATKSLPCECGTCYGLATFDA